MLYKFKISSTVSFFSAALCRGRESQDVCGTIQFNFTNCATLFQWNSWRPTSGDNFIFCPGLQTRPWPALTPGRLLAKNRILVTWEGGRQCHKNEGHRDFWCYRTSCHGMGAWKDEDRHIFRIIFCRISVWQLLQLLHNFVNLCKFFKNLMLQCNT